MKDPKEYLNKYNESGEFAITIDKIRMIEQIQMDAYNEAIDDAIKNVKIKETEYVNEYSESDGQKTFSIDKNSLIGLKKINSYEKTYKPGYYQFNIEE